MGLGALAGGGHGGARDLVVATHREAGARMSETGGAATIVVDGLSRWFAGVVAVSDVSLVVEPGVTALLGPNGAGKTTLLRAIAGLIAPSQGTVRVFGEPVRGNPALYRRIGYMPEHESVYESLTGRQFVELNARLQGVADVDAAVAKRDRDRRPRRRAGPQAGHVLARHAAAHAARRDPRARPAAAHARRAALRHRPGAAPAPAQRDPPARRGGPDDPRLLAHPRGGRRARRPHPPAGQRQAGGQRRLPRDPPAAQRPARSTSASTRRTRAPSAPACSRSTRWSRSRSTATATCACAARTCRRCSARCR